MNQYQVKGVLISISFFVAVFLFPLHLGPLFFISIVLFVAVALVVYAIESAIRTARGRQT
jgi:hypothetical protein